MKTSTPTCVLRGRRQELARLAAAIGERRSLLVFGPPDSGKSALVDQTFAKLTENVASRCLRIRAEGPLQAVLRQHAVRLFAAGDPVVREAVSARGAELAQVERWARKQTSNRLRSLLFRAFDGRRYWLFWENAERLSLAHCRFLREVIQMRKTPVYLLARGLGDEHVGQAGRLFWSEKSRMELGPLARRDAQALLEDAIKRAGISGLDLAEFRKEVLEASRCLPGAIVRMAAMAGEPRYRYGKRVKTKLIHLDYLVELASRVRV